MSADTIIDELDMWLAQDGKADIITFAGSGEPTLNSDLGRMIEHVKTKTDIPVAVLTNGTLLGDPGVRRDCLKANVVIPSVDAGLPSTFGKVNRPAEGLLLESMIDGLVAFRDEFAGEIWAEVMLVKGINDGDDDLEAIRSCLDRFGPDLVQINTVVRPSGAMPVQPVDAGMLQHARDVLGHGAVIIAPIDDEFADLESGPATEERVLALLSRRPCTLADVAAGLGIHRNEAVKYLTKLAGEGRVTVSGEADQRHYRAAR